MIFGSNHSRFLQALTLFLALGLLLAACGGGEPESGDSAIQPTTQPTATNETAGNDPTAPDDANESAPAREPSRALESASATAEPDPTVTQEPAEAAEPQAEPEDLAPELGSIDSWYNGGPTTLAALRGTPVLLVFWADY
ncbi:hypothetical protein BH23CHL2_BH23CHL2_08500 [soil metagenome]